LSRPAPMERDEDPVSFKFNFVLNDRSGKPTTACVFSRVPLSSGFSIRIGAIGFVPSRSYGARTRIPFHTDSNLVLNDRSGKPTTTCVFSRVPLSSGFSIRIGAIGFEPTTSSTPSWRAKPLRHAPILEYSKWCTTVKHSLHPWRSGTRRREDEENKKTRGQGDREKFEFRKTELTIHGDVGRCPKRNGPRDRNRMTRPSRVSLFRI
jgi:hypothetical protein